MHMLMCNSVHVLMHVYASLHVYGIRMRTSVYACVCMSEHVYEYLRLCTHVYLLVCVYMCVPVSKPVCGYVCMSTCVQLCVCV